MEYDSSLSEWELVVDIANFAHIPTFVLNVRLPMYSSMVNVLAIPLSQSVFPL